MRWSWLLILTVAVLGFGCGDREATKNDVEDYCSSYCDWQTRCNKSDDDCLTRCNADSADNYASYRASAVQSIANCFATTQDCGSDDKCFSEAIKEVAPKPEEDELYKRCMATRDGCDESPFIDDSCASLLILTDEAQKKFEACYDKPCEQMRDCVKAITG